MQQEVGCNLPCGLLVQLDEGELRGPIDSDEEIEPTLCCTAFGDVDVEVADRIDLELAPLCPCCLPHRATARCHVVEGSGEAMSGSNVGSSPERHRGSRRAAAVYACE